MTRGHGDITRAELAEWEIEAFSALRAQRDAVTPVDDELPESLIALLLGTPTECDDFRSRLRSL